MQLVSLELLLALSLTCVVQMALIILIIYKFRYASMAAYSEPVSNEVVEDIPIKSFQGELMSLANLVQKNRETNLLIVDADCRECKRMLTSSRYLNDAALDRLTVIFAFDEKEEELRKVQKISTYNWIKNKYQATREHIFKKLNINFFPFYMKLDQARKVVYKSPASIDIILERFDIEMKL